MMLDAPASISNRNPQCACPRFDLDRDRETARRLLSENRLEEAIGFLRGADWQVERAGDVMAANPVPRAKISNSSRSASAMPTR